MVKKSGNSISVVETLPMIVLSNSGNYSDTKQFLVVRHGHIIDTGGYGL